jgi:hypothetical protein
MNLTEIQIQLGKYSHVYFYLWQEQLLQHFAGIAVRSERTRYVLVPGGMGLLDLIIRIRTSHSSIVRQTIL